MRYWIIRLSVVLLAGFLAACAPSQTARGTGEFVDDATLTARVKTELTRTQGLGDALAINVDSYRGVVSLAGFVDNEAQARAAVQAARNVNGVREVRNNLQVKPKQ